MASFIANLPKTMKIRTADNLTMEVTGKLITESDFLMEAFETYGKHFNSVMFVPVHSSGFKLTLNFLEFFDLSKPFVPVSNLEVFKKANRTAMKFFDRLSEADRVGMEYVIDCLECDRLIDCIYWCVKDALNGEKAYKYCKWFSSDVDSNSEEDKEEEEEIMEIDQEVPKLPQVSDICQGETVSIDELCNYLG